MVRYHFLLREPYPDALGTAFATVLQRAMKIIDAGTPVGLAVAQQQEFACHVSSPRIMRSGQQLMQTTV
jgi:hypothetical protein